MFPKVYRKGIGNKEEKAKRLIRSVERTRERMIVETWLKEQAILQEQEKKQEEETEKERQRLKKIEQDKLLMHKKNAEEKEIQRERHIQIRKKHNTIKFLIGITPNGSICSFQKVGVAGYPIKWLPKKVASLTISCLVMSF